MKIDFWNRNKVRELKRELEEKGREIADKAGSIAYLKDRISELEKKIRGDRVCGGYCEKCEHGIKTEHYSSYMGGMDIKIVCDLDCKCKDFSRKQEK